MRQDIFDKLKILLPKFRELDKRRWTNGEELNRGDLPDVKEVLFDNSLKLSASERLLVTWCCSILDRQVPYKRVWSDGLRQAVAWIKRDRINFPQVFLNESKHFKATQMALKEYKQLGAWFVKFGKSIRKPERGNLYRLVGAFASKWLGLDKGKVSPLMNGSPGLIGEWKRLWMFIMMIRRDRTMTYWMPLFKEAIKEAAIKEADENDFINQWYNDWYPETECELPVDSRIKSFFNALGVTTNSLKEMAKIAHDFGQQEKVSPSVLDVAFVPDFNRELWDYGRKQGLSWAQWWRRY